VGSDEARVRNPGALCGLRSHPALSGHQDRGLRDALFGAAIDRVVGELDFGRCGLLRTRLRVVRLDVDGDDAPRIGLEIVTTTFMAYQMRPIALTVENATALKDLLSRAVEGN
jgi:hypothetical protein